MSEDQVQSTRETIPFAVDGVTEKLSPREIRLERAARVLQNGAIFSVGTALVVMVLALAGGAGLLPNLFQGLHNLLLGRYNGANDTALAVVILISLVNATLFLVAMVGVLAREVWALPALWGIALANAALLLFLGYTPALIVMGFLAWAGYIATRDIRAYRVNPVMLKELRGRMRGMRAFVVITVYLGLMSGFATMLYVVYAAANRATGSAAAGEIGRVLFMGIVGIEMLLIVLIAPAFTAGAITGERERQTYDLLRSTLLTPPSFVIGKLESALGYIVLLLLAGIPLESIAFLFGGVSEQELILSLVILAVTAVALSTLGIYFSAIFPRTLTASMRSYMTALSVTFGVPIVLSVLLEVFKHLLFGGTLTSPVIEALFTYIELFLTSINPITAALSTQQLVIDRQVTGFWMATLSSNSSQIPMVSPWILFTILYLGVSAVLVVLAIRRTRKIEA